MLSLAQHSPSLFKDFYQSFKSLALCSVLHSAVWYSVAWWGCDNKNTYLVQWWVDPPPRGREAAKSRTSSLDLPHIWNNRTKLFIKTENTIIWLSKYLSAEHEYYGVNIAQRNLRQKYVFDKLLTIGRNWDLQLKNLTWKCQAVSVRYNEKKAYTILIYNNLTLFDKNEFFMVAYTK